MIAKTSDSILLRTLIADDQPDILAALRLLLKGEGFYTEAVSSPAAVLEALKSGDFDVLLMDLNYARDTTSGQEGLDLLASVRDIDSTLPIVVMTAWGTIDLAVEAMKRGVRDFVQKPWENARLLSILRAQIERGQALRKHQRLAAEEKLLNPETLDLSDMQSLYDLFAEHVRDALQSRRVMIFKRDSREEDMDLAAIAEISDESKSDCEAMMTAMPDARSLPFNDCAMQEPEQANGELLAPVKFKDELIGFISLADRLTGEEYDAEEKSFLAAAADKLGQAMNNLRLSGQSREVDEAREIQKGLLPKAIPQISGCEISCSWRPARAVSGDYFDVLKFGDSKAALAVADVSGKGMPAALLMSNVQAAVKAYATDSITPQELCERVNRIICDNTASDKFITFFYCLFDAESKRLIYANAGHNAPVLARESGEIIRLEEGGAVFGPFPEWKYEQGEIALCSGDRILLFTDGVIEARNQEDEEFGEERLIDLLIEDRCLSASELQEKVLRAVTRFSKGHFQDDVTMIVLSVK